LSKDTLIKIANSVSQVVGRKLRHSEIDALTKFIARLPETQFYELTYEQATVKMARDFISRHSKILGSVQEQDLDENLSGVSNDTDSGGIVDYGKKELFQFTPDENAYKFSAHQNRRGDSVIDKERVAGSRSSPDHILPADAVKNQYMVNKELFKTMKLIQSFLAPTSTEEMFSRIQSIYTAYDNINLVHQVIQLDSRNRLPSLYGSNSSEYKWNIHTSGQPGQLGDVRIQDTSQQIIQLKAYPFWSPVNASTSNPYFKARLLLKEFTSQSITVSEFNNPGQSVPTLENYHFEFEVQKTVGDRMYLVPKQPLFSFRKPMARVETLTTVFRTPFEEELFDPDSGVFTITYGNPTLFTITNPLVHLLNTGDLIYVYNSDSVNANINAEINDVAGHIITKLNASQFTISVDSSILSGSEMGINVYYGSKRVFLQVELICLEQ